MDVEKFRWSYSQKATYNVQLLAQINQVWDDLYHKQVKHIHQNSSIKTDSEAHRSNYSPLSVFTLRMAFLRLNVS